MGVVLSTNSTLAPISFASSVVGFISFAFTIATFIRVFWANLGTFTDADEQVHFILTTLRQELCEERMSLRALRRFRRELTSKRQAVDVLAGPELDAVTIRTLQDSIRHLWKRFKQIERPFLLHTDEEEDPRRATASRRRRRSSRRRSSGRRRDSVSPSYDNNGYGYEKGQRTDPEDEEEWYTSNYCRLTLWKRFQWLRHKSDAMMLLDAVQRVQTRRIARQVGEIAVALHSLGPDFELVKHGIHDIEGRLGRVVGVRRIDS